MIKEIKDITDGGFIGKGRLWEIKQDPVIGSETILGAVDVQVTLAVFNAHVIAVFRFSAQRRQTVGHQLVMCLIGLAKIILFTGGRPH